MLAIHSMFVCMCAYQNQGGNLRGVIKDDLRSCLCSGANKLMDGRESGRCTYAYMESPKSLYFMTPRN